MPQTRISPAGMVARGALFTYLTPRLARDAKVNINALVRGVTSRNYAKSIPALDSAIKTAVKGKLAKDADISDLAELLNALKPGMSEADAMPMAAPAPAPSPMPTGGPAPANGGDGESEDIVSQIKVYLQQEGVSPEILNNLDAFLAEAGGAHGNTPPQAAPDQSPANQGSLVVPAGDEDMTDVLMPDGGEGLELRGSESTNMEANDENTDCEDEVIPSSQEEVDGNDEDDDDKDDDDTDGIDEVIPSEQEELLNQAHDSRPITRKAMDQAIRTAVKTAQDAAIRNQRAIREAERFVRPWVGEMAFDSANGPADIYRGALKAMGVKGVDKVHADALRPILEAQPLPSRGTRRVVAQDTAAATGSFFERFPDAKNITLQ